MFSPNILPRTRDGTLRTKRADHPWRWTPFSVKEEKEKAKEKEKTKAKERAKNKEARTKEKARAKEPTTEETTIGKEASGKEVSGTDSRETTSFKVIVTTVENGGTRVHNVIPRRT